MVVGTQKEKASGRNERWIFVLRSDHVFSSSEQKRFFGFFWSCFFVSFCSAWFSNSLA